MQTDIGGTHPAANLSCRMLVTVALLWSHSQASTPSSIFNVLQATKAGHGGLGMRLAFPCMHISMLSYTSAS